MFSIYQLKPAFQARLDPLIGSLVLRGITPNQVTIAACVMSMTMGLSLIYASTIPGVFLLMPIVLFVRMALNAVDGMLACNYGMKTKLGAVLNELGDVMSDAALYLPFALLPQVSAILIVLVVVVSIISEFAGVLAIQAVGERRYDGPMGKSDRAVYFGSLSILIGLDMASGPWPNVSLLLVLGLILFTVWNRIRGAGVLAALNASAGRTLI